MARRNDHTREELISMTLEQVKKFLSEHPHHELSLRKVAAMIGYVPSTLVNVFGNYNLLLLHAVAQTMDELFAEAEKQLQQSESTTDALHKLAYCYLNFAVDNPYRWQLIFQHTMNGEQLPEWQNERINNMINMLESLIRQLIPDQSETAVMEASRVLWAGVHGITLLTVDDKLFTATPVDGKALIDNLLDTYLKNWQV
ncbi:TetR/AcrR family transcriptional regulator [Photobacterium halotolerans]|uniref:TetR/AcrR family transcriptional regulator n=1 Tax=Photobacterium halotolerans TaxID=265726 RepID=UPI00137268A6|nr:TetR-like C-terminal domain-containing protein [Photobacterium halotolerans]NAX48035.1 TetR/AcrR family transcriptional regulator [Photobacterium halotolerans]